MFLSDADALPDFISASKNHIENTRKISEKDAPIRDVVSGVKKKSVLGMAVQSPVQGPAEQDTAKR
jgi:hypothetical protein